MYCGGVRLEQHCRENHEVSHVQERGSRGRVESQLKERAQAMLDAMGRSVATAIKLFFRQIIQRQALPPVVRVPNRVTERAMRAARSGRALVSADSMDDLQKKLGDRKPS